MNVAAETVWLQDAGKWILNSRKVSIVDSSDLAIVLLLLRADGHPSLGNGGGCVCVTSVCIYCVNDCLFCVCTLCGQFNVTAKANLSFQQNHLFSYWILVKFRIRIGENSSGNCFERLVDNLFFNTIPILWDVSQIKPCFLDTNGPICRILSRLLHSVVVNFWNEGNSVRKMGKIMSLADRCFSCFEKQKSEKLNVRINGSFVVFRVGGQKQAEETLMPEYLILNLNTLRARSLVCVLCCCWQYRVDSTSGIIAGPQCLSPPLGYALCTIRCSLGRKRPATVSSSCQSFMMQSTSNNMEECFCPHLALNIVLWKLGIKLEKKNPPTSTTSSYVLEMWLVVKFSFIHSISCTCIDVTSQQMSVKNECVR